MGCGRKRWKDEVRVKRLKIVQAAWQEKTTVFAKIMRGVVWCTQIKSSADGLILETKKFVDHVGMLLWRIVGWVGYGSGCHLLTYS
jgi:hypothetical protein